MPRPDLGEIRKALAEARDVRPAHIFAGMPFVYRADRGVGLRATYVFVLDGDGGGTWTVCIADDTCATSEGAAGGADVTIACDTRTFLDLAFGLVRPGEAFVDGRLRVTGDLALAMRFSNLMGG